MTQRVPLTIGRARTPSGLFAVVDDEDYERVSSMNWRIYVSRTHLYAISGYVFMHRFITEAPEHLLTEHINSDGLDNTRHNLRLVTATQNLADMAPHQWYGGKPTTSTFKGVSLMKGERARPWRATIRVESQQHFLGYHLTEEGAARAYDDAATRFFGPFARTNFSAEGA